MHGADYVRPLRRLECVECGRVSREGGHGWRAYLTDDENEPAVAVVYCRRCSMKEFGRQVGERGEARLPPKGTTDRKAAEAIAKVYGCPVEEAARVLSLGIAARIAEQNAARIAEQEEPPSQ